MTSSTKDLDKKLDDAISSLTLDTEGKLVQLLSLRVSFKLFDPTFNSFLGEWMENCNTNGRCEIYSSLSSFMNLIFSLINLVNWSLFGEVIQVSIMLLNVISRLVQSLMELSTMPNPLPDFDSRLLDDSEYVVFEFLAKLLTDPLSFQVPPMTAS